MTSSASTETTEMSMKEQLSKVLQTVQNLNNRVMDLEKENKTLKAVITEVVINLEETSMKCSQLGLGLPKRIEDVLAGMPKHSWKKIFESVQQGSEDEILQEKEKDSHITPDKSCDDSQRKARAIDLPDSKSPEDKIESDIANSGPLSQIFRKDEALTICHDHLFKSFESRLCHDHLFKSFESRLESDTGKITGANDELPSHEIQSESDIHKEAFDKMNDDAIAKQVFPKREQVQTSQSLNASVIPEKKSAKKTSSSSSDKDGGKTRRAAKK